MALPQATEVFIEKSHQLYEMILVRHGLMVVGYSFGAKSSIYKVSRFRVPSCTLFYNPDSSLTSHLLSRFPKLQALAASLGDLEVMGLMDEHKVQVKVSDCKGQRDEARFSPSSPTT